jgi:hypothetical protein
MFHNAKILEFALGYSYRCYTKPSDTSKVKKRHYSYIVFCSCFNSSAVFQFRLISMRIQILL